MSISSDEGHSKVITIRESKASSSRTKKSKKEKPELSPEELKQRRSDNAQVAKTCKKLVEKLEPLLKTCQKAAKANMADESFKSQVNGAKTVLKDAKMVQEKYKSKTLEALEFLHEEEHTNDLMASLKRNLKCIDTMKSLMDGGMDSEEIEKLAAVAKTRMTRMQNAESVD